MIPDYTKQVVTWLWNNKINFVYQQIYPLTQTPYFSKSSRKRVETRKYCGKRRNCLLQAISPFPAVFQKDLYCRH